MAVTTSLQFGDKLLMPSVESCCLPNPAQRLGVHAVTHLAKRKDVPQSVQLTVFTQQVLSA